MDKYVRRGLFLFDFSFLEGWPKELKRMNRGKVGTPFTFPESFIEFLQSIRCCGRLPSRLVEGFVLSLRASVPIPGIDHASICRRVSRLAREPFKNLHFKKPLEIAIDSTGLHMGKRGEWLAKKHGRKKGFYLKVHWAVDTRTGKVIELSVSKDDRHDSREFNKLLKGALKRGEVVKLYGDGAYDSAKHFKKCRDLGITPAIKTRKNAVIKRKPPPEQRTRNKFVRMVKEKGYDYWKELMNYGKRWAVETAYSVFKRIFGEELLARTWEGMVREVGFKTMLYNRMLSM